MFHNFNAFLVFVPPYSLYVFGAIIVFCTVSFILSLRICKIRQTDIQTKSHILIGTTIKLFIVSEIAVAITTAVMFLMSAIIIGPLTSMLNEFGGVSNVVVVSYYVMYGIIYANLQFPSAFILKKALGNQFAGVFVCFLSFNTGIWVLGNIVLGLFVIPH